MSKQEKIKEEIGAIKSYLGFVIAFIITIGAGVIKIYLDESSDYLLWLGIIGVLVLSVVFSFLAKLMHNKINNLEDL